jgi:hypothetical protein
MPADLSRRKGMNAEPGWHNGCECAPEIPPRQLFEKHGSVLFEIPGARLCAKRQPQRVANAAAGFQHGRAPPN